MRKNPYLLILGFSIAWTLTQAAFRAVYNAHQNEVTPQAEQKGRVLGVPDATNDIFVYVTGWGQRYHEAECQYVEDRRVMKRLRMDDARRLGYTACLVCGG